MQKGKKTAGILIVVIIVCIASGCSGSVENTPLDSFYERSEVDEHELVDGYQDKLDKVYQDAYDRLMDPSSVEKMEGTDGFDRINRMFLKGYYKIYRTFRSMSPIIVISSIVIGWLMMKLSRANKKIRRTGLVVFIIGIPVAVIVAVFGIGIMNGLLLY